MDDSTVRPTKEKLEWIHSQIAEVVGDLLPAEQRICVGHFFFDQLLDSLHDEFIPITELTMLFRVRIMLEAWIKQNKDRVEVC